MKVDQFLTIEKKVVSSEELLNPYGFKEENVISFNDIPTDYRGYVSVEDVIMKIVKQRFPIHYDLLCKEILAVMDNIKVTTKVRKLVDYGIEILGNQIISKDNFLFPSGYEKIIPRQNNTRKIEYVYIEELAEVMMMVLDKYIGVTKEALCLEVARTYNYNRITQNISSALDNAFEFLLENGKIKVLDDKVIKLDSCKNLLIEKKPLAKLFLAHPFEK